MRGKDFAIMGLCVFLSTSTVVSVNPVDGGVLKEAWVYVGKWGEDFLCLVRYSGVGVRFLSVRLYGNIL